MLFFHRSAPIVLSLTPEYRGESCVETNDLASVVSTQLQTYLFFCSSSAPRNLHLPSDVGILAPLRRMPDSLETLFPFGPRNRDQSSATTDEATNPIPNTATT